MPYTLQVITQPYMIIQKKKSHDQDEKMEE